MKKFKFIIVAILVLSVLSVMGGCFTVEEEKSNYTPSNSSVIVKYSSYEEIYNEYAQKIRNATPKLISEYNEEAKENQNGINGLANLCNKKISALAQISNEGVEEMAEFYYKKGNGKYSEYQDWSMELMDVYQDEAQKITNAYLDSVM